MKWHNHKVSHLEGIIARGDDRVADAIELAWRKGAIFDSWDEVLRYDSPVQGLSRTLTRPVDVHGQHMATGETVLLLFGSANRDDQAFSDADHFDLHRAPERQVAFGRGIHFCLGAALARLDPLPG